MDQSLYILYYNFDANDYYDHLYCKENSNNDLPIEPDTTKLFRLKLDLSHLNHSQQFVHQFRHDKNIVNVGHYVDYPNYFHYIVFNMMDKIDDYNNEIIIYQRMCQNCNFVHFQTLYMNEPIRFISLFTLGIDSHLEPYLALKTDGHFHLWKQNGKKK